LGRELCALDLLFPYCIEYSKEIGKHYFDFGTSNLCEGEILNTTLYQYKKEFGSGSILYESYDIDLQSI
jgi:hypothetical protein